MILAINTSTLQFALAVMDEEGSVRAEYTATKGRGHFGLLMPALDFMFTSSETDVRDLKAVIVALGPGSFTGLRVGLSLTKGLCHAMAIPAIGISSLEALASQIPFADIPITAIIDSRRDEFFSARFRWSSENRLIRETEDEPVSAEDFPQQFREPSIFVGNNYATQAAIVKRKPNTLIRLAPARLWNIQASSVGALGLARFFSGDFDDLHTLTPLYLRPPDIRPNPFANSAQAGRTLQS